jgi:hypothetical protein
VAYQPVYGWEDAGNKYKIISRIILERIIQTLVTHQVDWEKFDLDIPRREKTIFHKEHLLWAVGSPKMY